MEDQKKTKARVRRAQAGLRERRIAAGLREVSLWTKAERSDAIKRIAVLNDDEFEEVLSVLDRPTLRESTREQGTDNTACD